MTGPFMFGEIVCDDPECGYIVFVEAENER